MTEPPVEELVGWWLPSAAATAWPDQSGPDDDESLRRLLQVAYESCVDYGPYVQALDEAGVVVLDEYGDPTWVRWHPTRAAELTPDGVPERFPEAQLLQARAQWAFERTGGGDMVGPDGTQIRVYPMGWQVKALLRPDTGEPVIG